MSDRLPPLTALRAFDAAARHMSFARAAGELNVTPVALPFQIKGLCILFRPHQHLVGHGFAFLGCTSLASTFVCFPLRPRTTAWRPRDLSGPDEVLLHVPWFLDPGMPSFA